jgi:hypothetical protein
MDDIREQLETVLIALEQERKALVEDGRSPMPEAQGRVQVIDDVLPLLRQGVARARANGPPPPPSFLWLRSGRYEGGNAQLHVDLRVDHEVSGTISADLYRMAGGRRDYVASIRTAPGLGVKPFEGPWAVIGQDELGAVATGGISLDPVNGSREMAAATLRLAAPLNGVPGNTDVVFVAQWASERLRTLGLETEREARVDPPVAFDFHGQPVTFASCLQDAGLDVIEAGRASEIPAMDRGWGTAELHTLMQDFAQASLAVSAWELHLLLLSKSTREGLLGVMFDTTAVLPRQGAAVFAEEIRSIQGILHDRKLIQTIVHELGHALNLAHRFERVVGRADSLSHMNYDWRYRGGNARDEFWANYRFQFDDDEKSLLRGGPRSAVIPGGAAFHSVNYWAEGTGGYSPYVPEVPLPGFRLEVHPPADGQVFAFGQPVFLEVELINETGQPLELPPVLLDPKSGLLEILIRRRIDSSPPLIGAKEFVPILQRCFDVDPRTFERVEDGGSIRNNLNLTYGSAGFAFAEPGAYEVTALVAIPDQEVERDLIIRSNPLLIRVGFPKSVDEERDALELFRDDVGAYLALGGTDGLPAARDALQAVRERRQGRDGTVRDPVVAGIVRAEGINAGRPFLRYHDGRYRERPPDPDQAAKLLGSLDATALQTFDAHTAEHTKKLAESYRRSADNG